MYKNIIRKANYIFIIKVVVFLGLFIYAASYDPYEDGIYADQSTHILQTMSIAYDFDLQYEKKDLERYYADGWTVPPAGIFLNRTSENEYFYAKPILYSVVSSPFVLLFGSKGFIYWNALAVFIIFIILLTYLQSKNKKIASIVFPLVAVLASPLIFYIRTIHPDITIAMLLVFAVYFFLRYVNKDVRSYLIFSGLFMGFAVYEKFPFILFIPIIVITVLKLKSLFKKTFIHLSLFLISFSIAYLVPTLITSANTQTLTSYQGERWYFSIPPFDEAVQKGSIKNTGNIFSFTYLVGNFPGGLHNLPKNIIYFFIGRQTGILLYFPFTLFILLNLYQSRKIAKQELYIVYGILSYLFFYLILFSNNYYGGVTAFGNRYFLQIYPTLLLVLASLVGLKRVSGWSLAAIWGSIILYIFLVSKPYINIMGHYQFVTGSLITQLLPIEVTLLPQEKGLKIDKDVLLWIYGNHHRHGIEEFFVDVNRPVHLVLQSKYPLENNKLLIEWAEYGISEMANTHDYQEDLGPHQKIHFGNISKTTKIPYYVYIIKIDTTLIKDKLTDQGNELFDITITNMRLEKI